MASLADHQSGEFTKAIIIGDSKSGKTGALASLVKDGYKLRVLDYDNGLDVLKQAVQIQCPDKIHNVHFRTLSDERETVGMNTIIKKREAFVNGLKMLDNWKYKEDDGTEVDLGKPKEWGPDCILVIDSFTFMSNAAYDWAEPLTPRGKGGDVYKPAVYGTAQDAMENVLNILTGKNFRTNVIVISHVKYMDMPDGSKKGFPSSVGQALSPEIPRFFNTVVLVERLGSKRVIRLAGASFIDLANPASFKIKEDSLPIESGLATLFKAVRS